MRNFVRLLAFLLLIGTTVIFILKIRMSIPIPYLHLAILFAVGAVSLMWANISESKEYNRRLEEVKKGRTQNDENNSVKTTGIKSNSFKKRKSGLKWTGSSVWGSSAKRTNNRDFLNR